MGKLVSRGIWLAICALTACGGSSQGSRPSAAPHSFEARAPGATSLVPPAGFATAASPSTAEVAPARAEPPRAESAEPEPPKELPAACEKSSEGLCLPPRAFVKRLCQDAYPGTAIRLFEKSSPFTRGYVRVRTMHPVNTLGGPSGTSELTFGEEVLILTRTGGGAAQGMQMSGMGGYDVLRWDGTCATLADGELARHAPITPRHAPFAWQYIDTNIQQALLVNQGIDAARKTQRKHCQGASFGRRSASCMEADAKLNERIVLAVRTGMSLPSPERIP